MSIICIMIIIICALDSLFSSILSPYMAERLSSEQSVLFCVFIVFAYFLKKYIYISVSMCPRYMSHTHV